MLFADAEARVIGAAHAGWRGALTGVIEATVAAMEKLGADAQTIVAAAGPMIRQPNYEVGQDMMDRFVTLRAEHRALLQAGRARPSTPCSTCGGYIASRLAARRASEQIEDLGLCTYADPAQFYSYRRSTHRAEPDYGRHINAIALAINAIIDVRWDRSLPDWTGTRKSGYQLLTRASRSFRKRRQACGGA